MTAKKQATKKTAKKPAKLKATATLIAYKGFDKDMRCRGFQFEVGKTYTHDGPIELCRTGFHASEHPMDVWSYYPLNADNRYAMVELGGATDEQSGDTKRVGSSLTVKAELDIAGIVKAAVEWTKKHAGGKSIAEGYSSSAASSGNSSSAASSGDYSRAASSGDYSSAASSGDSSSAASSGAKTIAMVAGYHGRATAGPDGCIALAWHDGERPRIVVGYVGEGIEPDTWYRVDAGKLVRA